MRALRLEPCGNAGALDVDSLFAHRIALAPAMVVGVHHMKVTVVR